MFLHVDLATLDTDLAVHGVTGPVHDERHGVATTALVHEWLKTWLGPGSKIVVKPFLDLAHPERIPAADGHDPTAPMVDLVRLRDPVCVFPGCTERPAVATSTTSSPTDHPTTAAHPARPIPTTSPRSAATITA